jgi:hypothetical protein
MLMVSRKKVIPAALGGAALALTGVVAGAAFSGGPVSGASTSGLPAVYTQSIGQQAIPLQAIHGGASSFTPVTSSAILPIGDYTYTTVVNIGSVAPGSIVLCGTEFNHPAHNSGDYGVVDNTGGSAPEAGHCVLSGAAQVSEPNTRMSFWAVVYNGPAGAQVNGWSMTDAQSGPVFFSR